MLEHLYLNFLINMFFTFSVGLLLFAQKKTNPQLEPVNENFTNFVKGFIKKWLYD